MEEIETEEMRYLADYAGYRIFLFHPSVCEADIYGNVSYFIAFSRIRSL